MKLARLLSSLISLLCIRYAESTPALFVSQAAPEDHWPAAILGCAFGLAGALCATLFACYAVLGEER